MVERGVRIPSHYLIINFKNYKIMFEDMIKETSKFVHNDIEYDAVWVETKYCDCYGLCDAYIDIDKHKAILVERKFNEVKSVVYVNLSTMGALLFNCYTQEELDEFTNASQILSVDFANEIESRIETIVSVN